MPKSYSETEKEVIRSRLHQEARQCLMQYGVRKTTVDELVRRVHIPKGTFYLFYPSKEHLLFEIILEEHNAVQEEFMTELTACEEELSCERLTDLFLKWVLKAEDMAMFRLMTSGEIEILMRKLPPELVDRHFSQDDSEINHLLNCFPNGDTEKTEAFSAAFRGVFLLTMHRAEIGETQYAPALRLIIRGLAAQLIGEIPSDA